MTWGERGSESFEHLVPIPNHVHVLKHSDTLIKSQIRFQILTGFATHTYLFARIHNICRSLLQYFSGVYGSQPKM